MIILGKCWPTLLIKNLSCIPLTFPFLESWFIFLLLHNRITSLWQVQQLLTWKSNIRKVCIFSCLLMWCSSWKQGGEAVWGDLTALPTTTWEPLLWTWDQNVGKPFLQAWVCPLCLALQWFRCCGFALGSQKRHLRVPPRPYLTKIVNGWKREFCEAFCLC